jgi:hypothetical protein
MPVPAIAMMETRCDENDATTKTLSMHGDFESALHA